MYAVLTPKHELDRTVFENNWTKFPPLLALPQKVKRTLDYWIIVPRIIVNHHSSKFAAYGILWKQREISVDIRQAILPGFRDKPHEFRLSTHSRIAHSLDVFSCFSLNLRGASFPICSLYYQRNTFLSRKKAASGNVSKSVRVRRRSVNMRRER